MRSGEEEGERGVRSRPSCQARLAEFRSSSELKSLHGAMKGRPQAGTRCVLSLPECDQRREDITDGLHPLVIVLLQSLTMADVRALLAAERQARRISHPYLTYTKSGQLLCNVCQLNVKSEALWEGHLRSANHKKNTRAAQEASTRTLKRKLDDVDEAEENGVEVGAEASRDPKKPKSRAVSLVEGDKDGGGPVAPVEEEERPPLPRRAGEVEDVAVVVPAAVPEDEAVSNAPAASEAEAAIDEDEWAAFEREVAPLAQSDYSAATISAAPVTAEELARQKEENRRKQQDNEAEADREEEEGRVQEEVEIMEDLEGRVKRLREKREALRITRPSRDATAQPATNEKVEEAADDAERRGQDFEEGTDDDDDVDDWYS